MEIPRQSSIILHLTILITFTSLVSTFHFLPESLPNNLQNEITTDPSATSQFATDFGNLNKCAPAAIFYPSSPYDIAALIRFSYMSPKPFPISQRGVGHSTNGQTFNPDGVLVDMRSLGRSHVNHITVNNGPVPYADVGGEQLWIDVLNVTLKYGLTPRVFTDYASLTVGGTLSNAGISGGAFKHGPQISNVYELDVITGIGEMVTCSRERNPDLFYATLGGLGQFGVITRARIPLEPAWEMARWIRLFYTDVNLLTSDEEMLISTGNNLSGSDYVQARVLLNREQVSSTQSTYFSDSEIEKITQLAAQNNGTTYLLEVTAYYNNQTAASVDQKEKLLMEDLHYVSGFGYSRDVTYYDFINRLHAEEINARSLGLWQSPNPWLVVFVPKSKVLEFDSKVFKGILKNSTSFGSILLYPMNKSKWDDRMSAVTPTSPEEIFFSLNMLWTAISNDTEIILNNNNQVLDICDKYALGCKRYLPHYTNQVDWQKQFGNKWSTFASRKKKFDPKTLLSPGQQIFAPLEVN